MDIKVNIEDLTQVKKRMMVEVPAERARDEYDRVARKLVGRVRLPGFRPGKAPLGLVKQHYRSDIREEVLNNLVPESYETAVKDHSLRPIGQPSLENLHFEPGEPLKYTAEFEIEPEFELPPYNGLKIEAKPREVADEDVEKEMESLRERNAILETVEGREIQEGDFVAIRLEGDFLWEDAPPENPPKPIREDSVLVEVGAENTHHAFSEALIGMKSGEEKEFEVRYADDYQDQNLAGRRLKFHVAVNDVKKKVLPEADDDFAGTVGDFDGIDALRAKIREELESAAERELRERRETELIDKLVDPLEFEVPEVLVEDRVDDRVRRFVRGIASRGVDPMRAEVDWAKFRDDVRPGCVKEVKASLVLDKIADAERIEVSEGEIDAELGALAQSSQQAPEALRQWMNREGRMADLVARLRRGKTLDVLLERSTS